MESLGEPNAALGPLFMPRPHVGLRAGSASTLGTAILPSDRRSVMSVAILDGASLVANAALAIA